MSDGPILRSGNYSLLVVDHPGRERDDRPDVTLPRLVKELKYLLAADLDPLDQALRGENEGPEAGRATKQRQICRRQPIPLLRVLIEHRRETRALLPQRDALQT